MQTTLRLDDQLFRQAKVEAAREGITLTQFIQEGLRMRLQRKAAQVTSKPAFRTYKAGKAFSLSDSKLKKTALAEQEAHDIRKLSQGEN
jgi:hypothetical protein